MLKYYIMLVNRRENGFGNRRCAGGARRVARRRPPNHQGIHSRDAQLVDILRGSAGAVYPRRIGAAHGSTAQGDGR